MKGSYQIPIDYELLFNVARSCEFKNFSLSNNELFYNGSVSQLITPITLSDDFDLLEGSHMLNGLVQRECLVVKVICELGDIFSSNVIKGKKNSVSSYKEIKGVIDNLSLIAKSHGHTVSSVELSHTHLTRQFVLISDKDTVDKISINPLSDSDINLMLRLKQYIKAQITIRALTKDGICFSSSI